jgi:hypothetical protein
MTSRSATENTEELHEVGVSTIMTALVRRWYITVIVLAATGLVATNLWNAAEEEFVSSTTVSVVASPEYLAKVGLEEAPNLNPYAGNAATLAALLADSLANGALALPNADTAVVEITEGNPARLETFFTVTITSSTSVSTRRAVDAVATQAPAVLADIQLRAGAPADQAFTAILARPGSGPESHHPDRARLIAGTSLAGLVLAALAASAFDGAATRRTRRARRAARGSVPTLRSTQGSIE